MTYAIDSGAEVGTYDLDVRSQRLRWSETLCRICGIDPQTSDTTTGEALTCCHPADRVTLREGTETAIRTGFGEFEFRVVRPGGEVRRVFTRASLIRDDAGNPARLVGVAIDLTRRREIDESLKRSEARYRSLAEASAQIIWVATPDGGVTEISDGWTTLTGHPKSAALGTGLLTLIPEEDFAGFCDAWSAAMDAALPFETEFRVRHADGHDLHLRTRTVPVRDEAGRIYERIGTLTDITTERHTDAARRHSEERFSKAFQSSALPMAIREIESTRLIEVNNAWVALTGFSREDVIGRTLAESHWGSPGVFQQLAERFLAEGRVREWPCDLHRKTGETIRVMFWAESIDLEERRCALVSMLDITERQRAETELAESEERFRRLAEAAFEGIAFSENGVIVDCNTRLGNLTGYPVDQLRGMQVTEVVAPGWREFVRQHIASNDDTPYECQAVRPDGTRVDVEVRPRLLNRGGRVIRISAIRDITEQKRAAQALQESEERFRRLSEAAWEGIALAEGGVMIDANPQLAAMLGYGPGELVGKPVCDLVAPDSLVPVLERIHHGSLEPYEHDALRKDGSIITVEACGRTVPFEGRMIRMTAIRDVTERKQMEMRRRALVAGTAGVLGEDFFRSLVRHMAVAFNVKYAFVAELSPARDRLRALSMWSDDRYGNPFECALAGTACGDVFAHGTLFFKAGVQQLFPGDCMLADLGVESYLGIALLDAARMPIGVLAVGHDAPIDLHEAVLPLLTIFGARAGVELERIRAESEVRRLNAELEQRVADRTTELRAANHELEAFSYSVSHDLRAPLRRISGFVDLLGRDAAASLSETAREHLSDIAESAASMSTLIDTLLEFSRVGRAELRRIDVDLQDLTDAVVGSFRRETAGRQIEWTVGPLPSLRCDRELMRQVIANLAANAVKYSRTRAVARIEIGRLASEHAGDVVCFVRDNGVGFDMRYAHKLFGVFQRLHSASEFEGTGVGLANVQRIIHRHGGRVWATGGVDEGATFYFALPSADADDALLPSALRLWHD